MNAIRPAIRRSILKGAALLCLVAGLATAAGLPGPSATTETRTLCGFESPAEIQQYFSAVNWDSLSVGPSHVREGAACAVARSASGAGVFKAAFAPAHCLDVSNWDTVRYWVYNGGSTRVRLGFGLYDADGRAVVARKVFAAPHAGRWVEIPVAQLRQNFLDTTRIRKVLITASPTRTPGGAAGERHARVPSTVLCFDALQLVATRAPLARLKADVEANPGAYTDALRDNPLSLIEATADRLARAGTPAAARALASGFENPQGVYVCADALIEMAPDVVAPALATAAASASRNARMMACAVIGAEPSGANAALAVPLLRDPDCYVRHFAAEALADTTGQGAENALMAALDDPYPLVRLNAAKALAHAQTNRAAVVAALLRHVSDPAAGVNAIRALAALQASKAVPTLAEALTNADLAWEAARALAAMESADAAPLVQEALADAVAHGKVGGRTVEAMARAAARLACTGADGALGIVARQSPDAAARYAAVQALGRVAPTNAALQAALDDPSPLVRMAAARALAAQDASGPMARALRQTQDASIRVALGIEPDTSRAGSLRTAPFNFESGAAVTSAPAAHPGMLFTRRIEEPVGSTALPAARDDRAAIAVRAAGDETVCVQIGVAALRDIAQLRCLVPEKLPVTFRCATLEDRAGQPALIAGNSRRWLGEGHAAAFWLSAHVPPGTRPGVYNDEVVVEVDGERQHLPIALTILPLTLPPLDEPMHVLYTGEWTADAAAGDPAALHLADVVYADMAAHGMNAACPTPEIPYGEQPDGLPDVRSYRAAMACAARNGLQYPRAFFFIGNPLSVNKRKWSAPWVDFRVYYHPKRVQRLVYQLAQLPGRSAAVYLVDEPNLRDTGQDGAARNHLAALLYAKAKEVPGAYTAMTGSEHDFEALGDSVDLWVFGRAPTPAQAEEAMNRGARVTSYGGLNAVRGEGVASRLKFGCYTWRSGEFGQTIWTYPLRMCADVGPDGVSPYPEWECMRAGVDDLRYLRLLEARARQDGGTRTRATELFRALNAALPPDRDDPAWADVDPQKVRDAAIRLLLATEGGS